MIVVVTMTINSLYGTDYYSAFCSYLCAITLYRFFLLFDDIILRLHLISSVSFRPIFFCTYWLTDHIITSFFIVILIFIYQLTGCPTNRVTALLTDWLPFSIVLKPFSRILILFHFHLSHIIHFIFFMQLIRDIYPVDGPPHNRLEALELFMSIRIFDLGKECQVLNFILPTCLLSSFLHYFVLSVNTILSSCYALVKRLFYYFIFTFFVIKSEALFPFLLNHLQRLLLRSCMKLWWQSQVWWTTAQEEWEGD